MDSAEHSVDRTMIAAAGFDWDALNREAILDGIGTVAGVRYVVRRRAGYFAVWDQQHLGWASSLMSQANADLTAARLNRSA